MNILQIDVTNKFSVAEFRKYILEFNEALESRTNVCVNLKKANYVSIYGVMLLELYKDIFESKGLIFQILLRDHGLAKFLSDLFGKQEKDFERLFKQDYLKISRCMNSKETNEVANQVSRILKAHCSDDVSLSVSWLIGELADNAGVHGYGCLTSEEFPSPVYVAALDNAHNVEIAIMDRGFGIVNTLKTYGRKKIKGIRERDFLEKALEKGVSGHPTWSPGFGLYGTSQIILNGNGCMDIFSNSYSMHFKDGKASTSLLKSDFKGTFIGLRIKKDSQLNLEEIILASTLEQMKEWRDNQEVEEDIWT